MNTPTHLKCILCGETKESHKKEGEAN